MADDEANVPRWRRESVRRERAWTPPARVEAPPDSRHEARFDTVFWDSEARRVVGEDHVLLLNVPHEVLGVALTEIGSGREVELLEVAEPWARVRTAWGEEGWLPSRTLHR